jgi:DNA-binding sugar fermentation-stimulating protein
MYSLLSFIHSLIEECSNFNTLQREVKVKLKSDSKNLKEKLKKDVADDSRIDFQLTWNTRSDNTSPVIDSLLRKSDKSDAIDSKKSSEDLIHVSEITNMLLEVKSVTLAMKLPGDDKVRNKRVFMSSGKLI